MVAVVLFLVFLVFSGSESLIAFKVTQSLISMTLGNTTKFIVKAQSLIDGAMKTVLLLFYYYYPQLHIKYQENKKKKIPREMI